MHMSCLCCSLLAAYLPTLSHSLPFTFEPSAHNEGDDVPQTLGLFDAMTTEHAGVMFFAGGPVWALEWLPSPGTWGGMQGHGRQFGCVGMVEWGGVLCDLVWFSTDPSGEQFVAISAYRDLSDVSLQEV